MSQKEHIKNHLLSGKTLSPLECLQNGWGMRCGARIWDLRHEGMEIENIGADDKNYAVYKLKKPEPMYRTNAGNIPIFKEKPREMPRLI